MKRLDLGQERQAFIQHIFQILVIIAALATLPLTAAYWFGWNHWGFTVADWTVWSVFVSEYLFYLAISSDRWRTTKNMWLSVTVVVVSFPLLHEVLQSTRIIRLARPIPLVQQGMLVKQIELFRLTTMRSKGTHEGWKKVKEYLGEDHWITRWMVYLERLKAWSIQRIWPGERSKPSTDER